MRAPVLLEIKNERLLEEGLSTKEIKNEDSERTYFIKK